MLQFNMALGLKFPKYVMTSPQEISLLKLILISSNPTQTLWSALPRQLYLLLYPVLFQLLVQLTLFLLLVPFPLCILDPPDLVRNRML